MNSRPNFADKYQWQSTLLSTLKEIEEKLFEFCDVRSLKNLRLVCRTTSKYASRFAVSLVVNDTYSSSVGAANSMILNTIIVKRLKLPAQLGPQCVGNYKNLKTVRRVELLGLVCPKWIQLTLPRFANLTLLRVTENALSKQLFPVNEPLKSLSLKHLECLEIHCEMTQGLVVQSRTGFFDYCMETVHRNIFCLLYLIVSPRLKTLSLSYDEELNLHSKWNPLWNWKTEALHKFINEHAPTLRALNFNDVDLNATFSISHRSNQNQNYNQNHNSFSRPLRQLFPLCEHNRLPEKLQFLALTLTADNLNLFNSNSTRILDTDDESESKNSSDTITIPSKEFHQDLFDKDCTISRQDSEATGDQIIPQDKVLLEKEIPDISLRKMPREIIGIGQEPISKIQKGDPSEGQGQGVSNNGDIVDNLEFWCGLLQKLTRLQEFHGRFWFDRSWKLVQRIIWKNCETLEILSVGFNWRKTKRKRENSERKSHLDLLVLLGKCSRLNELCLCLPDPEEYKYYGSFNKVKLCKVRVLKLDILTNRLFLTKLMITDALCYSKELTCLNNLERLKSLSLEFVGNEGKFGVTFDILLTLLELRSLDHLVIIDFNFNLDFRELDKYRLMSLRLNCKLADSHLNSSRFFASSHPVKYISIVAS